MKNARIAAALAFLVVPLHAGAAMLYKSVGPNGTVMFSDIPPAGSDARVVEQRVLPEPKLPSADGTFRAPSSDGSPSLGMPRPLNGAQQMLSFDQTVAQANADLDQAEHALAMARRGVWSPLEGVRLNHLQRTQTDEERLEFYKKRVATARQYLMLLLKEKPHLAWAQ